MSARGRGVEAGATYFAGALSLVFHPCSPYVPTFRSDIRYFAVRHHPKLKNFEVLNYNVFRNIMYQLLDKCCGTRTTQMSHSCLCCEQSCFFEAVLNGEFATYP